MIYRNINKAAGLVRQLEELDSRIRFLQGVNNIEDFILFSSLNRLSLSNLAVVTGATSKDVRYAAIEVLMRAARDKRAGIVRELEELVVEEVPSMPEED